MSADFVPGWMRRLAFVSMAVCSIWAAWRAALGPIMGDLGPIWISAGGGGLGSRGELGGSDMTIQRFDSREQVARDVRNGQVGSVSIPGCSGPAL